MTNINNIIAPNRFVGLHGHSSFSTFDGLGYPIEHIEFVTSEEQGMDAWALTDHGNGSGLAHARTDALKIIKRGKKYRQLYGVEFYFVPSLSEWRKQLNEHNESIKKAKNSKEKETLLSEKTILPPADEEETEGQIVENEDETKKSGSNKPEWKRYYHLVVIAKNQKGLGNLFTLVKKSFKYGFYRFPRIDFEMLKEHGEGLIVSTACVGGLMSGLVYKEFSDKKFDELNPGLLDQYSGARKNIEARLDNAIDRFVDAVGAENFFLELQFNDLGAQHLTNRCLIDASIRNGIKLISTADSHFPRPELWKDREMYKKLGWLGSNLEGAKLPTRDEVKTLLYPKNAYQMWQEFKKGYEEYSFYDGHEELVKESIERTHDIAWMQCEDTWIDTKAKLPTFDTSEEKAFNQLAALCKEAMIEMGLDKKPEYVARVKEELSDVKFLKFENYFLTLYHVFKKAEKETLFGAARGSGGGSLINYLLKITHVDPIEHNLMWARFLGRHKVSWPDVDSDVSNRDVLISVSRELFGEEAVIPVSNFNTLQLKSLVKDISKFYGIPFEEVNAVTGPLIDEVMNQAKDENTEKGLFVLLHDDCMKYSKGYRDFMEKYPEVCEHVSTLFKQNRSIGRHAGGVLIADPEVLEKTMPVISVRGELQTPWSEGVNFRHLEDNGFLKFDFLGLALMRDVENCIRRILKKKNGKDPKFLEIKEFFDKHLNSRYCKADDQKVWEYVYHQRKKVGIFQFSECLTGDSLITMSDGSRKRLDKIKPGDIVFSYDEKLQRFNKKEVLNFFDNGEKECITLNFENGSSITCTYDHKFLTKNRGWVEAISLTEEDELVEYEPSEKCISLKGILNKSDRGEKNSKVVSKIIVGKRKVFDIEVEDSHNYLASGVVVHNSGARKFCEEAKPRNITELAAVTSIFRPGPLKAGVHKMWVDVVSGKKKPEYDHPLLKEVLEETHGFTIFQEQFMILAQKIAGFTDGESDKMRKTLVKKSHDATAGKVSERDEIRKKFIDGAVSKNRFSVELATKVIDTIEYFSSYGFNRAHAVGYAFDSYYSAWLHTYYEKEWLMTILQKESSKPESLAKAIKEIKEYGYNFAPADINFSGEEWEYSDELEAFVPPFGSVKGIGANAMQEILESRPYYSLSDILFNENGEWRLSKINKTCLSALCKIEAFNSLKEIKEKRIQNHRQLLLILTDGNNYEILKKGKYGLTKTAYKKMINSGSTPTLVLDELIEKYSLEKDWTRGEKINNYVDLTSTSPGELIFHDGVMNKLQEKNIRSALELEEGEADIVWFCITKAEEKKTKNGKTFYRLTIMDSSNRNAMIRVWGKLNLSEIDDYTIWLAEVKKDEWGLSCSSWKMKLIDNPNF